MHQSIFSDSDYKVYISVNEVAQPTVANKLFIGGNYMNVRLLPISKEPQQAPPRPLDL